MYSNRIYIIGGAVVILLAVVAAAWLFFGRGTGTGLEDTQERTSTADPVDVIFDFYMLWMRAMNSTSTDPYQSGLATDPVLGEELSARLVSAGEDTAAELDPVLCQTVVPESIRTKSVYTSEDSAQVLILSRGENVSGEAVATLKVADGDWRIIDIECTSGESAPEREHSFEREGQLLKSVPPPLDPQYWHLVFEENGVMGHTAPLFFDAESVCIAPDGNESVCNPSQFTDADKARVQGEMTESGVNVKRLQLLE